MPDPHERHARSKDDGWGPVPARSQQTAAAAAEPSAKPRPKKERTRWCGGHKGREHQPQITLCTSRGTYHRQDQQRCGWASLWVVGGTGYAARWACYHHETCAACGKILTGQGSIRLDQCPHWPGTEVQRAMAEVKAEQDQADYEARRSRWPSPRPRPSGPQGYRRPRAGGRP